MYGCGEQEAGVASGSGWNLWVWLAGPFGSQPVRGSFSSQADLYMYTVLYAHPPVLYISSPIQICAILYANIRTWLYIVHVIINFVVQLLCTIYMCNALH